ncbi:hypothetical protein [Hyalangium gracile]|uniref:hypothetical protein n=1 Tax=Hyalangium gracile TaxID=394092 RepID=UPI001CCFFB62|nr:hypothetical protein [Hyalangium gracile]
MLVPGKESEPAILVGWLDVARKEAQVRGHGVMELLHESRYGDAPDLREEEYERFLDKLMDALFESGIRLVMLVPDMLDQEPTLANPMPSSAAQRSAQAMSGAAQPTQPSPLVTRKGVQLLALAFVLGLSAQPLFSWTAGAIHWLTHAPGWIQQASQVLR